jgi:type II secretory pathway pseudopilin PulG
LLIVVAIIAILAAIAVPNFLEAQVRAKIARCKADMRSMATAIESYSVDWNQPPIGTAGFTGLLDVDSALGRQIAYSRISTPVAYITSAPSDPFSINKDWSIEHFGKAVYQYQSCGNRVWKASQGDFVTLWEAQFKRGFTFATGSMGPSVRRSNDSFSVSFGAILKAKDQEKAMFVYDATNGTVSLGMIIRTNKGIYEGQIM